MAGQLQPDIWVEWRVDKTPSGTDIYRFAFRPLADQDSFKEPRLRRIGTIRRSCSTDDREPIAPTSDLDLSDDDGIIRGILADLETRHGIGGEIAVHILSEVARKAGAVSSQLIQGRVSIVEAMGERRGRIKIAGAVGGLFLDANQQKTFPQQRIGPEHPNAPTASKGLVYPLILGSHFDVDAVDADGNSAEKGLLPAIDVGDVLLLADGTEVDQGNYPIAYLGPPTHLAAVVEGTAGTDTVRYDVTAWSAYGETEVATLIIENGPGVMNGTDRVALTWDAVEGAVFYAVYRNHARLTTVTDPSYTDVGAASTGQPLPEGNTAVLAVVTPQGDAFPWTRFVAAGKCVQVVYVYTSDLAEGAAPARMRLGDDQVGTELLLYGESGYPHPTPYVDIGGIRQTVFYLRGPRVKHHREGVVTVAWNGHGVEDIGDGTGATITGAFEALEWFLNEEVLKDGGVGYLTGLYGPAEVFANGVPMLHTAKFTEAQVLSAAFLNDGVGYRIGLALTDAINLRTFLQRFHTTFATIDATDRLGRYYPVLWSDYGITLPLSNTLSPLQDEAVMSGNLGDESAGTAAALLTGEQRAYRERINIVRWAGQTIAHDQVETRVLFSGSWDADGQRFRYENVELAYDPKTYGHEDTKQRGTRLCYYSHDLATLGDSNDRYLRRHLVAPRIMGYVTDLGGLDDDLGVEILLTHREGSGSAAGDVDRRCLIIDHATECQPGLEEVTHRVLDLERAQLVENPFWRLQDEATMSGNLLDEDAGLPPVGAWRLR